MHHRRCPYLGLESDRTLTFTEPTDRHRCYGAPGPRRIGLSHQSGYCLTLDFEACPRFLSLRELEARPRSLPSRLLRSLKGTPVLLLLAWATLALLAIVLVSYSWVWLVPRLASPTQAPSFVILPSPSATEPATQTPTASPTATLVRPTPTPPPPAATPPPGLLQAILVPASNAVGWVFSGEELHHFGDRVIHVGVREGQVYQGAMQFSLTAMPPGSRIEHATLELMGLNADSLDVKAGGTWALRLLSAELDENWPSATYQEIHNAAVAHTLSPQLSAQQLAAHRVNVFTFTPAQLTELERRLESGLVSFRLDGPSQGTNNLFTWDTAHSGGFVSWPVLRVIYQPPPTPTPALTTPTPTTAATPPTRRLPHATATPAPADPFAPAPLPPVNPTRVIADLDDQKVLRAPPRASATPTPTAFPQALLGRIAFYSDRLGGERIFVMDPDGSDVAPLTEDWVYEAALAAQAKSSDGRYLAQAGWQDNRSDLFRTDLARGTRVPITRMSSGTCRHPAWSPDNQRIAFVSSQNGHDEIFLVLSTGSAARQLTTNPSASDDHPTWSPDGTQLAYASSGTDGRRQIWVVNLDGTGHRNISSADTNDWDPVWIKPALTPTLVPPTRPPPPTQTVTPSPIPTPTSPPLEVTISGVSKRSMRVGVKHDDVEIYGSGFQEGVTVLLTQEGRDSVFAYDVSLSSDWVIKCKFDLTALRVPYAEHWTLHVENPDGQSAQTWFWITTASAPPAPTRPKH